MTDVVSPEIPRFFKRTSDPESLEGRFHREVHSRYLSDLTARSVPSDAELREISQQLDSIAVSVQGVKLLTYKNFRKFSCPPVLTPFFSSTVFLSFPRDSLGRISLALFYSFLVDSVSLCQSRICLSESDSLGFLTETQIDQYVRHVALSYLENFLHSASEAQDFLPFFAVTFARRAMIDLDRNGLGKIPTALFFQSYIFINFHSLLKGSCKSSGSLGGPAGNMVDGNYALRLYQTYANLDGDNDGMLSRSELAEFEGGAISAVVISRVFEEVQNFNKQFDYKGFLEFAMIMENKGREHSMRYLFRILDIEGKGYLTRKDLVYLMNAVISGLYEKRQVNGAINPNDVADEIFDMLTPRSSKIRLSDFLRSKAGPLVMGILVDSTDLFHYENRENYLHQNSQ